MKKISLFLFLCILSYALQAQHYRPLHDSVSLQFQITSTPSLHLPNFAHLYPTFLTTDGNDSIFNVSQNCTPMVSNWPLGKQFVKFSAPHRYGLIGLSDDTCYLHTDYQLGATWEYHKQYPNATPITASFVDKELYAFSGVIDSAIVIKLSTGDTIRISKHYGICNFGSQFSFPPTDPYQGSSVKLILVSMSNTPVQQPIYKPQDVFHYLPGETLYYKDGTSSGTFNPITGITLTWTPFKLVVLNANTVADTTYYDFNWYEGQQFQNGPYSFQLKVTPEYVTTTGNSFFPALEDMFSLSQCDINYSDFIGSYMNIIPEHDQSIDNDYVHTRTSQGLIWRYWYDTDNGFFQYTYGGIYSSSHITELIVRYAPGTPDTDNLYLTSAFDQQASKALRVYPVPCNDQFTVEGISLRNMKIEITTLSGTTIPASQYSVSENTVSTGNLNSGVYILYLKSDSSVLTKMFVKE